MVDAWTARILHLLRTEPKNLDRFDHQQICKALEGRRVLEDDHAKLRCAFDNLCRIVDIEPAAVELYLGDEQLTDERVVSAREDLRNYQDALASVKKD
jgi:hypothetical protein